MVDVMPLPDPREVAQHRAAYLAFDALLPSSLKRALVVLESIVRLPSVLQSVMADVETIKDELSDLRKRAD